jgi:hypothetical protein
MDTGRPANRDDVFHVVGYAKRDILHGGLSHLLGLSVRVQKENEELSREVGPLVPAWLSGKVKRESVEALFVAPALSEKEIPYRARNNEMFLCIEYLNDPAIRLCRRYGIDLPRVIETVGRGDVPRSHARTVSTVHYRQI